MRTRIEVGIETTPGQTSWPVHLRTWAQQEKEQLRAAFAHLISLAAKQGYQVTGFRTTREET